VFAHPALHLNRRRSLRSFDLQQPHDRRVVFLDGHNREHAEAQAVADQYFFARSHEHGVSRQAPATQSGSGDFAPAA